MILSSCAFCGKRKRVVQDRSNRLELSKLHLKSPGFTYSTCAPFTRHCKRIQKVRETGNLKHFYRNELDKGCFAQYAAYLNSKDKIIQIRF